MAPVCGPHDPRSLADDFMARWRPHYLHLAEDYPIWSTRSRPPGVDGFQWLGVRLLDGHFDEWGAEIVATCPRDFSALAYWTVWPFGNYLYLVPLHHAMQGSRAMDIAGVPRCVLVGRDSAPYYALHDALNEILQRNRGNIGAARERELVATFVEALPDSMGHLDQEAIRAVLFDDGYYLRLARLRRAWRQAKTSRRRREPRERFREEQRRMLDRLGLDEAAGKAALLMIGLGEIVTRRASGKPVTDIPDGEFAALFAETRLLVDEIRDYDAGLAHVSRQQQLEDVWKLTRTSSYPAALDLPRERQRRYQLNKAEYAEFKRWCLRLRFPLLTRAELEAATARARRGRLRATYSVLLHRLGLSESERDSLKYLIHDIARR